MKTRFSFPSIDNKGTVMWSREPQIYYEGMKEWKMMAGKFNSVFQKKKHLWAVADMTVSASDEDESLCENWERSGSLTLMGQMFAIKSAPERSSILKSISSERIIKQSAKHRQLTCSPIYRHRGFSLFQFHFYFSYHGYPTCPLHTHTGQRHR